MSGQSIGITINHQGGSPPFFLKYFAKFFGILKTLVFLLSQSERYSHYVSGLILANLLRLDPY